MGARTSTETTLFPAHSQTRCVMDGAIGGVARPVHDGATSMDRVLAADRLCVIGVAGAGPGFRSETAPCGEC